MFPLRLLKWSLMIAIYPKIMCVRDFLPEKWFEQDTVQFNARLM